MAWRGRLEDLGRGRGLSRRQERRPGIGLAWRPGFRATGSTKQEELPGLASSLTSPTSGCDPVSRHLQLQTPQKKEDNEGGPHALPGLSVPAGERVQ